MTARVVSLVSAALARVAKSDPEEARLREQQIDRARGMLLDDAYNPEHAAIRKAHRRVASGLKRRSPYTEPHYLSDRRQLVAMHEATRWATAWESFGELRHPNTVLVTRLPRGGLGSYTPSEGIVYAQTSLVLEYGLDTYNFDCEPEGLHGVVQALSNRIRRRVEFVACPLPSKVKA